MNALILCGGYSSRMERDKALIPFHGIPQVEWLAMICKQMDWPVFISCRLEQSNFYAPYGILLFDERPGLGPVSALYSAYTRDQINPWCLIPCDMPGIDGSLLDHLQKAYAETAPLAYMGPSGLLEPFPSIWDPGSLAWVAGHSQGEASIAKLLEACGVRQLTCPWPEKLQNINSPQEWQEWQENQ